ncbi:hypothetical protein MJO28_005560 [Puccinia striiformis f. sp. tritici]|uniref:Uncharacterized protein n=1 Tax=Puccinia striiformis f. sp. tritici TaxID=168172 RepID=A0ACC0EL83_9BASI|nr:hypothetical protein MJO28_005560 [Puccinia striiformis f. sp. tritici]KAI9621498.1 hypothetical protein KEM48_007733 [Puccinia striiformis f. sp. tritici PST-130]
MARPTSFCSSTGFDYHSTTVRLRLAYRRRQGIVMKPHSIDKKFRELDLFPEITKEIAKELAREEEERSKRVQDYEEHLRKYPDMQTFPKPTNRPIIPRLPTTDEYDDALRHVADNFRIIDHGRTIAFDAKEDRIIYSAQYYKISHLEREHRENLDSLCDFLHRCKQFISFLATRDQDAIEANQGEYTNLMEGSEKAGKAIWSNFRLLTAKAADETKEYFQNLTASLAFPSNSFWIDAELDEDTHENLPTGFALVIPTFKSTGKIALKSEGHQVENGQFVLPDYKIAFSFPSYFICGIIFRPQASAHGTMQATEVGDSTRLGVCIQPVPKLSYDIKKVQPAPLNETSSTSGN